ncbi:MAG: carbohydrate binding domain-containing protein [Lentisphaeria bacterium]|nr:carbohydrate binding domain-containing protein [Lentisphaeria bacterium]
MKKKSPLLLSVLFFGTLFAGDAAAKKEMFHFLPKKGERLNNITNIATWMPVKEAGADGYVRVDKNGNFHTDAGPIRFWGTNFVYDAAFPLSHKDAERVADDLARYGFNCVRLHHMDERGRGVFGEGSDVITINPARMERLDYFLYQLKKRGIYVNINLHVLRSFGPKEGFKAPAPTAMGKGINEIDPRMIALQKKYARDLLTHVNRYTKLSYCEDPAVAFIELNNENSLLNWWRYGALDNMVPEYAKPFQDKWNYWLKEKYGTDAALAKAWNQGRAKLGKELLHNTGFAPQSSGNKKQWVLQSAPYLTVKDEFLPGKGPEGKAIRRLVINRKEEKNRGPQIVTAQNFTVKKGEIYTLSFHVRTARPQYLKVNCMKSYAPWGIMLGLNAVVKTKADTWEKHEFVFCATDTDDRARLTFIFDPQGEYEIANASLKEGGVLGLQPGQSMEDCSVPLIRRHFISQTRQTVRGLHDGIDFVYDMEKEYNRNMYDFIRNELGAKALITGTQVHISPIGLQTKFDFVDTHTYWNHPVFPKGNSWDKESGWYVSNDAMVNNYPGTIGTIAAQRVAGMPYVISEYNHAEPNQFVSEGFPMVAAYGAFQNWNGIYSFAYSHRNNFDLTCIPGFFDINTCSNRLVHLPACAAMFVRGDVAEAGTQITAPFSIAMERSHLRALPDPSKLTSTLYGLDPKYALLKKFGLKLHPDNSGKIAAERAELPPKDALKDVKFFESDTKQLVWDARTKDKGMFCVNTPRTKLFTGFCGEKGVDLDGFAVSDVKSFSGAATISAVCTDGKDMKSPGRILLAASGVAHNRDGVFELLPENRATLRKNWGADSPIMCEGITAKVKFDVPAGKMKVYALDSNGERMTAVPVRSENGRAVLRLSPEYKTLWYEVIIR